jgi:hypothetical protein
MELINEGRLLSHAMRERIVMTTSEAFVIMTKLEDISRQKHLQFEELCRLTGELYIDGEDLQSRMLVASGRRDSSEAKGLLIKVRLSTQLGRVFCLLTLSIRRQSLVPRPLSIYISSRTIWKLST